MGPNALSFSSLRDFEAIYGFNKSIEKGEFYDFGREPRTGSESIFSARTDAAHREHRRKVFGPALSGAKIAGYNPVVARHVDVLLSRLDTEVKRNTTVDVAIFVHKYTLDTMLEVIYGEKLSPQPYTDAPTASGTLVAFRMMSKMAWGAALLPWFGWLMSTRVMTDLLRKPKFDTEGRLKDISALVAGSRSLILTHPEQVLHSHQASIVKNWLGVPADDPKKMEPGEVWAEAFNLVFAGLGSTAAALTLVLFCLGTPEGRVWQEDIRLEAKGADVVASSTSIPQVLLAVIKETLRHHAPFPTAFPRTIIPGAETAIPNLLAPLPVGTLVSAHTYVLGRSKEIWGEDADKWMPQRWLGSEHDRREMEEKFVVFSKGSRGCVGKDLAMLMIAKAVLGLVGRWKWKSIGEMKGKSFLEMQYEECRIMFQEDDGERESMLMRSSLEVIK